ncbi:MAG: phosphatase PAP2 family protein [Clostridia bacterium]|nr:phosphatase PAP2 family protein [Clostridia bacterium]
MTVITHLGDYGILWVVLCIALLCRKETRKCGIALAVAMAAGLIICNIVLKNLVARTRPFIQGAVPILINPPMGHSFPSGHTTNSFIAATVISMNYKKYSTAAFALAALISFSRIYLYVHYPSDVIAGAVLGAVIGYGTVKLSDKL